MQLQAQPQPLPQHQQALAVTPSEGAALGSLVPGGLGSPAASARCLVEVTCSCMH